MVSQTGVDHAQAMEQSDRHRILLVDEDHPVRDALGRALALEDYEVLTAASVDQANNRLAEIQIDLLVIDWALWKTESGAFAIVFGEARRIPIIATTTESGHSEEATQAGIDYLVQKPFEVPLLLQTVKSLLVRSQDSQLTHIVAALQALKECPAPSGLSSDVADSNA